jgi:dihydrofolate reductase
VKNGVRIAFVVAAAQNGVIGRNGHLPWRLPSDLKRFRRLTLGKPIIMGRKTYDSIGKPLDGRDNIVVTRQPDFAAPGLYIASSIEQALTLGRDLACRRKVEEMGIIGGAEIFRAALPQTDRVYLTLVHASPAGDTYFDTLDPAQWVEMEREPMPTTANDEFTADFIVLERKG